jgi:hypothetical protein
MKEESMAQRRKLALSAGQREELGSVTLTEEKRKAGGEGPRLPDQASRGPDQDPDSFATKRQHGPVNVTPPTALLRAGE